MDHVALAVVVPAGPQDQVGDTIASVLRYTEEPRMVVVVDDTGGRARAALAGRLGEVSVIDAPLRAPGSLGGLWAKIAAGYRHVLDSFPFDVLLRLDADALLIGPGLAALAMARFEQDPTIGMLGSYRFGPDGGERSWSPAAERLHRECGALGLGHPHTRGTLRALRRLALANGYVPGEHALGGAYLHRASAVRAIAGRGWLDLDPLRRSRLGEDHLFALITVAAGYRIADFGGPHDPLALAWQGLPASPPELLARRKLVTHSVRRWKDWGEQDVRRYFAEARAGRRPPR